MGPAAIVPAMGLSLPMAGLDMIAAHTAAPTFAFGSGDPGPHGPHGPHVSHTRAVLFGRSGGVGA